MIKRHVIARMQDATTGVYYDRGDVFQSDDEAQIERLERAGCLSTKAPEKNGSAGGAPAGGNTDNGAGDPIDATDGAVKFAEANKIDLKEAIEKGLKGSGTNGRIGQPDVAEWLKAQNKE